VVPSSDGQIQNLISVPNNKFEAQRDVNHWPESETKSQNHPANVFAQMSNCHVPQCNVLLDII